VWTTLLGANRKSNLPQLAIPTKSGIQNRIKNIDSYFRKNEKPISPPIVNLLPLKSPPWPMAHLWLTFLLLFLEIDLEWNQFAPGGEIVKFLGRENTLLDFL
jgi:hypothetical protein